VFVIHHQNIFLLAIMILGFTLGRLIRTLRDSMAPQGDPAQDILLENHPDR